MRRPGQVIIFLLRQYQRFLSPFLPSSCRFDPTCSEYAIQSIDKYGLTKGFILSIKRVLRCHPLHAGGFDPVP